nr:unnamed protein product [Callosobruchus analis]
MRIGRSTETVRDTNQNLVPKQES